MKQFLVSASAKATADKAGFRFMGNNKLYKKMFLFRIPNSTFRIISEMLIGRKRIVFSILFLLIALSCMALELPMFFQSARAVSMGDAFTAVSDDESALSYNPAGLVQIEKDSISVFGKVFNYNFTRGTMAEENYFNGYAGGSAVFRNFGLQLIYDQIGDRITSVPGNDFMEEGFLITGGFAYDLDGFYIGSAVNVVAYSGVSEGMSFDLGFLYPVNERIKAGITIKNLINSGFAMVMDDYSIIASVTMPVFLNLGISIKPFDELTVGLDIHNFTESMIYFEESEDEIIIRRSYHLGGEYVINRIIAVRAGVSSEEERFSLISGEYKIRPTISFGVGFFIDFAKIDIAVAGDLRDAGDKPLQFFVTSNWKF